MTSTITKIIDTKIPDIYFNPKKIGIEMLDKIFSVYGGPIPSMAYMFTGSSGAGKTTISNYIMAGMSSKESPAVFISLEMSKEQVKFQFENKVDFTNTLIVDSTALNTVEAFQDLLDTIAAMNPSIVVLDSLQYASALIYGDPTSTRGQSEITKMIIAFAKSTLVPVIVIGQCGKDGTYIGPSFVKHALDGHLHADYDPKTQKRTISFEKNRFGSVGEYVGYFFNKDGSLNFVSVEDLKPRFIDQEFGWYKAQKLIEDIYVSVITSELKNMIKANVRVPIVKFDGTNKVDYADQDFHMNVNSWMHFPAEPYFIQNTVFIDLEFSKNRFTEENLDTLKKKFAVFIDRYPQFEKPSDLFILQFLILITQGILQHGEHDEKFWKTLDRIVLNHS